MLFLHAATQATRSLVDARQLILDRERMIMMILNLRPSQKEKVGSHQIGNGDGLRRRISNGTGPVRRYQTMSRRQREKYHDPHQSVIATPPPLVKLLES